jgi:glycosyltransferase involved in cell wall biosynthesis
VAVGESNGFAVLNRVCASVLQKIIGVGVFCMSVSVVITTYNDAQYLERAIRSVFDQTTEANEVIVVDDGSDNTRAQEIVESKFSESLQFLRFFRKANGGPSSARNCGLTHCRFEHVAFLDTDDFWLPDNLTNKINMLRKCGPDYFGVYGSYIDSYTNKVARFSSVSGLPDVKKIGCKNGFPGGAPAYLFRREALLSIDGLDESLTFNEDFDLILRLIKSGMLCKGDSNPGFCRNRRTDSLTRRASPERKYRGVDKFLSKAERIETLPPEEIRRRRKVNALELAKGLRDSNALPERIRQVLMEGFSYSRPSGLRECLAFIYMKTL